jgi:hypothetical protein
LREELELRLWLDYGGESLYIEIADMLNVDMTGASQVLTFGGRDIGIHELWMERLERSNKAEKLMSELGTKRPTKFPNPQLPSFSSINNFFHQPQP